MTNRTLFSLLGGVTLIPMMGAAQTQRPNIIIMNIDDMGYSDPSCFGGDYVNTTNIDRLASEGMRMTNNFASVAMSVPIRASMYTGLYPAHHGSFQNHKATYTHVKSVTHYLSDLGYRVGRAGKAR